MNSTNATPIRLSLPDDLPEDQRLKLLPLAEESELIRAPFAIDEHFIRHWCETLEDGNPLYLDGDTARAHGLDGLMLPPVSVFAAVNFPFRWPWPPKGGSKALINYQIKDALSLPVGIATEAEMTCHLPMQEGDRIDYGTRLVFVSPRKTTRLGEGRFATWVTSFWNQRSERVAEMRTTCFLYGQGSGEGLPKGGYSNAIEDAIEGDKTTYQPSIADGLYWDDVKEGDALGEIRMPINMTRCVYMASATRDFSPQHSNPEYAKTRSKTRDVFLNTQFNMGMVSRLVTDWTGKSGVVRRVKIKMRENVCAGDDMIVNGKVTKKYVQDGEHRIDVDVMISNQCGPATPCEATVALPVRGASAAKI